MANTTSWRHLIEKSEGGGLLESYIEGRLRKNMVETECIKEKESK